MPENDIASFNPAGIEYSEISQSRILVAVSLVDARGQTLTDGAGSEFKTVSYWDSLSGGDASRSITPRKQPGKTRTKKIPGLHINFSQVTLTRAWNSQKEHRQPVEPLIRMWLQSPVPLLGIKIKIEQIMLNDAGKAEVVDWYIGPIVSYAGPKGNGEGDAVATETIVIDPEDYDLPA